MAKYYRFNPKGEILVEKTFDESFRYGVNKEYIKVKKQKKWGIALFETLEVVIPIIYDSIENWADSKPQYIIVVKDEIFSIINLSNKEQIGQNYNNINLRSKNDKYAVVTLQNKKGIIDIDGEIIIQPIYDNCQILFNENFLLTEGSSLRLSNANNEFIGEKIIADRAVALDEKINNSYITKYFRFVINETKYGLLDSNFNLLAPCVYDRINFTNNDTFFTVLNGNNLVINNKNVILKEFSYTFYFHEEHLSSNGVFNYIIRKDSSYGAKCGIMNEKYEIILPIEYDWIDFSHDVWVVRKGRSEYILDGNYIIIPDSKYKEIGNFEKEGIACAKCEDLKYVFINKNGKTFFETKFDSVYLGSRSLLNFLFEGNRNKHKSGLCGVCINSKWGYIDLSGRILIECKYDEISDFDLNNNSIVKYNGKWGVINNEGKIVIECKYDEFSNFDNNNNSIVKYNGKWGVIDDLGKSLIPFEFDSIVDYNLHSKLIISNFEDKYGLIDFSKKIIINYEYDNIDFIDEKILTGYAKKPIFKKTKSKINIVEPIGLLDSKLLEKHNTLIHDDLLRVMIMAVVSGEVDELSNELYVVDVIRKDLSTATFISGYAGGGVWDECTFVNEKEYNGEEGGFTIFDYVRDDEFVKGLVGDYICEIDDELDEYQYKSLNHFNNIGDKDLKLLYSVWYNDSVNYTEIYKKDKKRFKNLLKATGGIRWKDWDFKF
jgi:hypothetical protein